MKGGVECDCTNVGVVISKICSSARMILLVDGRHIYIRS